MFSIFKRIKNLEDELKYSINILEDKLEEHIDKTKRAFDTCKNTDEKLSGWDDDRRAEIRSLAEHLGVSINTGVHLVEDDE
jgi:hypothetical protein